jgi:hypothetical protein
MFDYPQCSDGHRTILHCKRALWLHSNQAETQEWSPLNEDTSYNRQGIWLSNTVLLVP